MTERNFKETIRFNIGDSALGPVLVAVSGKGVCSILFGEESQALMRDLQDRFPEAQLVDGEEDLAPTLAKIVGLIETPAQELESPLDMRGTEFQQRVWRALRDIPVGATASYKQIAINIGSPKAVRAVAGACAANALSVAIPCHRVVRSDGGLSGYRWGVARKRSLLAREGAL